MLRVVLAVILLFVNGAAWSQAYPARAVRIVVPFATGGRPTSTRACWREAPGALAAFRIEDRPGGGSIVGTDVVAKSPPDGLRCS